MKFSAAVSQMEMARNVRLSILVCITRCAAIAYHFHSRQSGRLYRSIRSFMR